MPFEKTLLVDDEQLGLQNKSCMDLFWTRVFADKISYLLLAIKAVFYACASREINSFH